MVRNRIVRNFAGLLLTLSSLPGQPTEHPVRNLYIEPFATKTGAQQLREDVAAEVRKLNSVSLVSDESQADVILGGGGEVWVKGYRSLNPRSGRLPSAGQPMYGGYLSVELKNHAGLTIWSYLATPGEAAEDVPKELAKRIAKKLAAALDHLEAPSQSDSLPRPATTLHGAGATFPYPVYRKWFANFGRQEPAISIAYDAVGSETGIRRLLAGSLDFGASDSPQAIREIASGEESKYLFFPSVVGAVVPIVNLPGLDGEIAFTPQVLAGIYLGKITKWNDPLLKQANRGVHLPDLDIVVVHRADGSGTSYAWTDYLSKTNLDWQAHVGAGLAPRWPTGRAATGNDGVAKLVKEIGGAIGYVEFIYALDNHLNYGKVRNRNGEFVAANLESIGAAVGHAAPIGGDFKVSLVDAPGADAYPIASFTWLVVPARIADDARRNALTSFLKWMLGPGQRQAAALGYLELPTDLVAKELEAVGRIR